MAFDVSAFLDDFRAEATEGVRTLDAQLLKLERDPSDPSPVREMFLSAHTIKGGAAMLGLGNVNELAHAMEDVLAPLRDEHRPLDSATADLLFTALDSLRDLVEQATPGPATPDSARAELVASLRERADVLRAGGGTETAQAPAPPPAEPAVPVSPPRILLVAHPAGGRFSDRPDAGDDAVGRCRLRGGGHRGRRAGAGAGHRRQLPGHHRQCRDAGGARPGPCICATWVADPSRSSDSVDE
jgi:chemotaxis protein histidine kinase CheA